MIALLLLACAPPEARTVADCAGSEECLVNLAARVAVADPDVAVAALGQIHDPTMRLAAGGAIFANRDAVFPAEVAHRICAALQGAYEESFCERRLGQGHLRGH